MAEKKIAVMFLVALLVVVGALVPVASADVCADECSKECAKGKKEVDIPSCAKTCEGVCRFKAATPAEKAAMKETFNKAAAAATAATAASTPGFAKIKTGCLRECNGVCSAGKGKDCNPKCENLCKVEAEELAADAETYTTTPTAEKKAIVQVLDKRASGPTDKVKAFAAPCTGRCVKYCDKDPACVTTCDNACLARSVSDILSLATPAEKEAIEKDIEAVKAGKL